MATKVTGANIVNTVSYKTDRASLKRARKEIRDLQKLINNLRGSAGAGGGGGRGRGAGGGGAGGGGSGGSAAAEARRKIKEARDEVRKIARARIRAEREAAQRAARAQEEINRRLNVGGAGRGGAGAGGSAEESARAFREEFARRERAAAERRAADMRREQERIDRLRRDTLNARNAQQRRDRNASRVAREFAFDSGRMNLRPRDLQAATRAQEALNRRYREGAIDLADYRQQSRHLLRNLRDQSRETRTLGQRLRDLRRGGNGGLGLGGAALGLGVAGGIGAAYLGAGAAKNALSSGVAQSRGLSRVQTMGLQPEEMQALQLAALRATGFNLSYEKISDIAKDTQDKVGQLSLGKWTENKKDKTWSFSGGGELSDWLKIMTERGGFGRDEALSTLQSAKGPVEFAIILQNLKKTAKLTDQEFTALSEAINDFSYVTKSVGDNAQNVDKAMSDLAYTGRLYTDQEKENLKQLSNLAAEYQATTGILQGKFSSSFVEGLEHAGINSNNLGEEMAKTSQTVKSLGEFVGQTAGMFLKFLNVIPGGLETAFGSQKVENGSGWYYDDSFLGGQIINPLKRLFMGGDDANWNASTGFNGQSVMSDRFNNFANNSIGGPKVQNHLSMTIQIDPNSGVFENAFSAQALDIFNNGMDDLSFDINNTTSNM